MTPSLMNGFLWKLLPAHLQWRLTRWAVGPLLQEIERGGINAPRDIENLIRIVADRDSSLSRALAHRLLTIDAPELRRRIFDQLQNDSRGFVGGLSHFPDTLWFSIMHQELQKGTVGAVKVLALFLEGSVKHHFLYQLLILGMKGSEISSGNLKRAVMTVAKDDARLYHWLEAQFVLFKWVHPPWGENLMEVRKHWALKGDEKALDRLTAEAEGGDREVMQWIVDRLSDKAVHNGIRRRFQDYIFEKIDLGRLTWLLNTPEGRAIIRQLRELGQKSVTRDLIARADVGGLKRFAKDGSYSWDYRALMDMAALGSPQALGVLAEQIQAMRRSGIANDVEAWFIEQSRLPGTAQQAAFDLAISFLADMLSARGEVPADDLIIEFLAELGLDGARRIVNRREPVADPNASKSVLTRKEFTKVRGMKVDANNVADVTRAIQDWCGQDLAGIKYVVVQTATGQELWLAPHRIDIGTVHHDIIEAAQRANPDATLVAAGHIVDTGHLYFDGKSAGFPTDDAGQHAAWPLIQELFPGARWKN